MLNFEEFGKALNTYGDFCFDRGGGNDTNDLHDDLFDNVMMQASLSILKAYDEAVFIELSRVRHTQYDSHEICKYFAENLRKRLTGERQ
ncbi:hypothetical protein D3C87_324110 [compost metagenome]